MALDGSVVVIDSDGIGTGGNIEVEDDFLSNDTLGIKGYKELISQLADDCLGHGLIDIVRNIIVFLVNFKFVFARFLHPLRIFIVAHD